MLILFVGHGRGHWWRTEECVSEGTRLEHGLQQWYHKGLGVYRGIGVAIGAERRKGTWGYMLQAWPGGWDGWFCITINLGWLHLVCAHFGASVAIVWCLGQCGANDFVFWHNLGSDVSCFCVATAQWTGHVLINITINRRVRVFNGVFGTFAVFGRAFF